MKKIIRIGALTLLVLLKCENSRTQEYIFKSYTAADGLPSTEVITIAKDHHGILWVGTAAGLSKFDGYTFQNFLYDSNNNPLGYVNIIKYAANKLYIGTTTGLFVYTNNQLVRLNISSGIADEVEDIFIADKKFLLIASAKGPLKIPWNVIETSTTKKIVLEDWIIPEWKKKFKQTTPVRLISQASDQTIYIAVPFELYRLHSNKLESIYFKKDKSWNDKIQSIFPISKSLIYFDAALSEINKIENNSHISYAAKDFYVPGINAVSDSLWYSGTSGIFCFHPSFGKASVFIKTMEQGVLWPEHMLKDDGFFWLASHEGLFKITPSLFTQYTIPSFSGLSEVHSIYQLKNNTLLFGLHRGKISFKKDNTTYNFLPEGIQAAPRSEVRCMIENENGSLWIGTAYQGIALYHQNKITRYTSDNGLHNNTITNFFKTSKNELYALGSDGITQIIENNNKNFELKSIKINSRTSKYGNIYGGIESSEGRLWFAGEEGLFYLRNDSLHQYIINGERLQIQDIKKDADNTVWIATNDNGILTLHFNQKGFPEIDKYYSTKDGLAFSSFQKIIIDKNGNAWAASAGGLTCITKIENRILNFSARDGFLQKGYSAVTLFEDNTGKIWVVSPIGTISFYPDQLLQINSSPKILLTDIKIPNQKKAFYYPDNLKSNDIRVRYKNNEISFTFTAIDYLSEGSITYFYKLDGLDTGWTQTNSNRNITFQRLAPGKYNFLVKARNAKGIWTSQTASYIFRIMPPFWKRWWFISTVFLLFAALFIWLIKRREKIIKQKEARKTEVEKLKAISYQYQLEIEQVVNFFATSINEKESIDEMLWDVAKNCISKLGFEDCVIYMKDPARNILVQKAAWGPKTTEENKIINPIEIPVGTGIVGSVALTGKIERIDDTSADRRYIADDANRLSELAVPIVEGKKVIGVIDSEHHDKNFYTDRHVQILNTIATLCSEKISKMKAEKATLEKQVEVLQLNTALANSQLTALRAQMNPHFIFNALNSIQQFILQGNADEANRYLSRFSRLQREILNNSDHQFITLEKEKEILEIYLELEQLRIKEDFEFNIVIGETIDTDEVMIPPMIVQPFAENAIWHGLMPKKGNKKLLIEFKPGNGEDQLICTITDTGIGREAAAKNKQQADSSTVHKSRGLSLVYERLEILQQQLNKPFHVQFEDLQTGSGEAAGTKVTLTLHSR